MKKYTLIILTIAAVVGILFIAVYAALYTYDRFQKIQHNTACDRFGKSAPGSDYARFLPTCVYEIVPPTLWEKLTGLRQGARPVSPISEGCNQSATTTDCAKLMRENPPPPVTQQEVATTTKTIGNFSIEYPSDWYFSGLGGQDYVIPGAYNISKPSMNGDHHVFIFTTPSSHTSINPSAKSLNDYRTDYPLSATSTRQVLVMGEPKTIQTREEVRILSTEEIIIHDIPMLRQRYSIGHWQPDFDGKIVFWNTDEAEVQDELRYVLFDGKTFVVVTG